MCVMTATRLAASARAMVFMIASFAIRHRFLAAVLMLARDLVTPAGDASCLAAVLMLVVIRVVLVAVLVLHLGVLVVLIVVVRRLGGTF